MDNSPIDKSNNFRSKRKISNYVEEITTVVTFRHYKKSGIVSRLTDANYVYWNNKFKNQKRFKGTKIND